MNLIKCEIKRIYKRVIVAILVTIGVSLVLFGLLKINADTYIPSQINRIDNVIYAAQMDIHNLESIKDKNPYQQAEQAFLISYVSDLEYLKLLYKNPKTNDGAIQEQRYKINQSLSKKIEKEELSNKDILLIDEESVLSEIKEYNAYQKNNTLPPVNPLEPNVSYSIYNFTNGYTYFILIIFILMALFMNNTWSEDMESKTHIIYISLPYSKLKLFTSRLFTNICASLCLFLTSLLTISIISSIFFNTGNNLLIECGNQYVNLLSLDQYLIISKVGLVICYSILIQMISNFIKKDIDFKIWTVSFLIVDHFILQSQSSTIHLSIQDYTTTTVWIKFILILIISIICTLISYKKFLRQR